MTKLPSLNPIFNFLESIKLTKEEKKEYWGILPILKKWFRNHFILFLFIFKNSILHCSYSNFIKFNYTSCWGRKVTRKLTKWNNIKMFISKNKLEVCVSTIDLPTVNMLTKKLWWEKRCCKNELLLLFQQIWKICTHFGCWK